MDFSMDKHMKVYLLHIKIMSKSHAKTFWGLQSRSPNSLRMGFTFLMDANTSNYFYNYFMGVKETLISH